MATKYKDIRDLEIVESIFGRIVAPSDFLPISLMLEIRFKGYTTPYILVHCFSHKCSSPIAPTVSDLERFYTTLEGDDLTLNIVHPQYEGAYRINGFVVVDSRVRDILGYGTGEEVSTSEVIHKISEALDIA